MAKWSSVLAILAESHKESTDNGSDFVLKEPIWVCQIYEWNDGLTSQNDDQSDKNIKHWKIFFFDLLRFH